MTSHGSELRVVAVLVGVSITVMRHHDHRNSYKEKHLIGADLQFQRFSPLMLWREAWQHAGRKGFESSTS